MSRRTGRNRRAAGRLRHITVESGHEAITGRADVDDAVIDQLRPLVQQALDTGADVDIPGGYWMRAELRDGDLACGIGHEIGGEGAIIAGMRVQAAGDEQFAVLTASMGGLAVLCMEGAPLRALQVAGELADLERCIAWTWLELQRQKTA